jgi:inosine-uridine nucleoside N-ribohydrolase
MYDLNKQILSERLMKVWLDWDPGQDDMLAIIMAAYSRDITLLGISTSSGNSTI